MKPLRVVAIVLLSAVLYTTPGSADEAGTCQSVRLPATVVIDEGLREDVEELAALSPTLRRQLEAIGGASARVEVRISPGQLLASSRAETTISRYDAGYIKAQVVIPAGVDFVELLAHELEHVVEQIEGVDLAALVRTGEASRSAGGIFETIRARAAGRAAAVEVDEAVRAVRAAH